MYVVIFRAKVQNLDQDYYETAKKLREIAMTEYGCTEFCSVMAGNEEITLSYWNSMEQIIAWKSNPQHLAAQKKGKDLWYVDYRVDVTKVQWSYTKQLNQ